MDPYRIYQEIQQLKKLFFRTVKVSGQQNENKMKLPELNMPDLDKVMQTGAKKKEDMKELKKLCKLHLNLLKMIHYQKTKNETEYAKLIQQMHNELEEQEAIVDEIDVECDSLQAFLASINARKMFEPEMKVNQLLLEIKIANLGELLDSLNIPSEINMNEFFSKLEQLQNCLNKEN